MQQLFEKEVYVERRHILKKAIGKGIILLTGNADSPMNYTDNYYPFRQDSSFLYYFGLDIPGLVGIIDVEKDVEAIYGKEADLEDVIWTGPMPTLQELAAQVGISMVSPLKEVAAFLQSAIHHKTAIHTLPFYRADNKLRVSSWLQMPIDLVERYISVPLIKAVVAQREVKQAVEIAEIDKAASISAEMHVAAMQFARPGMYEYEIAAKMEYVALAAAGRLSYPTILTINGQTLHNHYHGHKIQKGHMVLADAGAENVMHYAGDLTRTFPVDTVFTASQRDVYNVVLTSFEAAVAALKPGVAFKDIHRLACVKLLEGLKNLGIIRGDVEAAVEKSVHTLFFQCGLGHMMGLDVHDMENLGEAYVGYTDAILQRNEFGWKSLRLGKPLSAGFVLTVEPGIYFIPQLIDSWKAQNKLGDFINYEQLENYRFSGGIRIEDNFLITPTGARLLGQPLAKTVQEIEEMRYAARYQA
ncbi:Xaa-Pro aminopeptidase [Chitinophaga costaii]|uniref:Xaa-Pro aminopeptidase n=1 Tax=Chitinophaga costaii TaxID=1335309 RepID=A0A1C3YRY3_9BACT|nr:aminopeptidase P family protein [Chitinophaga costaii]PUZ30079.1 aminopeptidase P family protein [Chitinophaga costaii]SCB72857.1 Xaa-Pro aminopeptidase [Chitinophaga costaii]